MDMIVDRPLGKHMLRFKLEPLVQPVPVFALSALFVGGALAVSASGGVSLLPADCSEGPCASVVVGGSVVFSVCVPLLTVVCACSPKPCCISYGVVDVVNASVCASSLVGNCSDSCCCGIRISSLLDVAAAVAACSVYVLMFAAAVACCPTVPCSSLAAIAGVTTDGSGWDSAVDISLVCVAAAAAVVVWCACVLLFAVFAACWHWLLTPCCALDDAAADAAAVAGVSSGVIAAADGFV